MLKLAMSVLKIYEITTRVFKELMVLNTTLLIRKDRTKEPRDLNRRKDGSFPTLDGVKVCGRRGEP